MPGSRPGAVRRVLPHRRLILVVQVHGAVGLADEVRVARVAAADRQRTGADDAPVLAREPPVERERRAVDRAHAVLHHAVVEVRRRRDLGQEDHVRAVLARGLPDDVLDVREVALDLAELHRELDRDDAAGLGHHAATDGAAVGDARLGVGGRSRAPRSRAAPTPSTRVGRNGRVSSSRQVSASTRSSSRSSRSSARRSVPGRSAARSASFAAAHRVQHVVRRVAPGRRRASGAAARRGRTRAAPRRTAPRAR